MITFRKLSIYLLFLLVVQLGRAQEMEVKGIITKDDNIPLKGVVIKVFKNDGSELTGTLTNDTGGYYFRMPLVPPDEYLVRVSLDKFVTKTFKISTTGIPKKSLETPFGAIIADIELYERIPEVDYSYLNNPLNHYYYNPLNDRFEYDKNLIEKTLYELDLIKRREKAAKQNIEIEQMQQELAKHRMIMKQKRMRIYLFVGIPVILVIVILVILRVRKNRMDRQNYENHKQQNL